MLHNIRQKAAMVDMSGLVQRLLAQTHGGSPSLSAAEVVALHDQLLPKLHAASAAVLATTEAAQQEAMDLLGLWAQEAPDQQDWIAPIQSAIEESVRRKAHNQEGLEGVPPGVLLIQLKHLAHKKQQGGNPKRRNSDSEGSESDSDQSYAEWEQSVDEEQQQPVGGNCSQQSAHKTSGNVALGTNWFNPLAGASDGEARFVSPLLDGASHTGLVRGATVTPGVFIDLLSAVRGLVFASSQHPVYLPRPGVQAPSNAWAKGTALV